MKSINKKHLAALMAVAASAGVVATGIFSAKVTPVAVAKIHEDSRTNHNGDPNAYTKKEAFMSAWKYYILPTVIGSTTILCIGGSSIFTNKMVKSAQAVCLLAEQSYNAYRDKLIELHGKAVDNEIMKALNAEKSEDVEITSPALLESISLDFEDPTEERHTFYDSFSKRYFESTYSKVLQAEYHLNRNFMLGDWPSVNDFYRFLGISEIEGGDDLRWGFDYDLDGIYWIDFNHRTELLDDGMEIKVIEMPFEPTPEDTSGL